MSPPCRFAMLMAVCTAQRESVEVVTGLEAQTASKSVRSATERIGVRTRIQIVADSAKGLSFMALSDVAAIRFGTRAEFGHRLKPLHTLKPGQTKTCGI